MMFADLNANGYEYSSTYYQNEFEDILRGIIVCYNYINSSGVSLPNNENAIRNVMLNKYLKIESFKRKYFNLANYHFDFETVENAGRADIRILPINPYINDTAYYIIECKRLDTSNLNGFSGLNAEYIKNGVCRFVTGYYTSYFGINGMIGFVVDNLDINENATHLNSFISRDLTNDRGETVNARSIGSIIPFELLDNFNSCYISKHQPTNQNEIVLYHLMLNFSMQIQ